ncbi:integrin alpha-9-like [Centruroides sculpturatus]|uniref:integrin alpha-9-like n=1 Tax=Centruroides sculpturatus TaxID=218467 RepID=UPI000C6D2A99|nr:integrin alpha-9-like [Centruroides sculpturatus]
MKSFTFYIFYNILTKIFAFNIESRFPLIFHGSEDSYFGYSVALHENSQGKMALITATKANSTLVERQKLHEPGVLYKCNISSSECQEILLNKLANENSQDNSIRYHAKEDEMWLGVSLDIQPTEGNIVTCGHLWKNQLYKTHYLTNGICYLIDKDMRKKHKKKVLPFIAKDRQSLDSGAYYYAFAQGGMSAAFSEDGKNLLIGSPGFYDWIGTVINYLIPENYENLLPPIVPNPPKGEQTTDSYIGYSVTSGKFFELGELQFVSGAPRDGQYKGRIYIFEKLDMKNRNIIVLQTNDGEQVGSYFGASVLGINVNNDKYTDLLVGAPLYSYPSGGDEGKVYVYISNGKGLDETQALTGSKKFYGRFGTAIANAGDLNQDGFLDVVIGAPYEEERGAVYIYHGNNMGINSEFSQRITAKEVNAAIKSSHLSGFGISISKGKDIDDNKYPDILVGSYQSDNAALFRTRPIVRISAIITFKPTQINTNSSFCEDSGESIPCFIISYCLNYTGNHVPLTLNVSTELRSMRQREELKFRRYLLYKNRLSWNLLETVKIEKDKQKCFSQTAFVKEDKDDFITPININLRFRLTYNVSSETSFCETCPILDSSSINIINKIITFQTGCRESDTCISDLVVNATVLDEFGPEGLILGKHTIITLSVEVWNLNEPAYMTELQIILPDQIKIINQDSCSPDDEHKDKILLCNVGNPLKQDQIARYIIKLDVSQIPNDVDELVFTFTATTASEEEHPENNNATIVLPLKISADITIIGNAGREQILLGKEQDKLEIVPFDHYYTVLKYLPSTVNSVSIQLYIPTTFHDKNVTFLQLTSILINEGKLDAVPASCNVTQINLKPEEVDYEKKETTHLILESETANTTQILPSRKKRSVDKNNYGVAESLTSARSDLYINYALNCTTSICEEIVCAAGPFTNKKRSATFHIKGFIYFALLRNNLKQWDNITIQSEGKVQIQDEKRDVQPKKHQPDEAKVATILVQSEPLPAKKLPTWIIAVSVGVGILVFLIILLGLIKFGFFKRKKKDELEKMTTQAMLQEWEPYLVSDEEVQKTAEAFMKNMKNQNENVDST